MDSHADRCYIETVFAGDESMRCLSLAMLAAVTMASPAEAAGAALCDGWAGKWTAVANTSRQPDGGWKVEPADPDWHVASTGAGRCRFYFGPGQPVGADLDVSGPDYVWTVWEKGKPQPPQAYSYLRRDISDPRHWSVEILSRTAGARRGFARVSMTMADDQFFIATATSRTRAGPYRLESYTTHRRLR